MTWHPLRLPKRWKDAVWSRLEGRFVRKDELGRAFVQKEELERRLSALDELARRVDSLRERTEASLSAISERHLELVESIEGAEFKIQNLRDSIGSQLRRTSLEALRDAEDVVALSVLLAPLRPLPPLGGWALSPDTARFVVESVLSSEASRVLECGSGSSTVLIALAMARSEGRQLSVLEHDITYLERTRDLLQVHRLDWVELLHTPLVRVEIDGLAVQWYQLPDGWLEGKEFDLVVVDGPPSTGSMDRYPALPFLGSHLVPGGRLILDDATRGDEVTAVRLWEERYPEFDYEFLEHTKGTAVVTRRLG